MNTNADKISDMEAEVMKIVWNKNTPLTYAEIRTGLNKKFDWGNQVINTMIKRLVKKGVLQQEKKEVYYYTALVPEADYMKSKTLTFIQKIYAGNGKELLSALIDYEEVTPDDLNDLHNFWKKGKDTADE